MGRLNRFRKSAEVWNPLGHLLADDFLPLAGAVFPHDDHDVIALTDDLLPLVDVVLPGPEVLFPPVSKLADLTRDPFVQADSLPPANA
ncbi:hypothetical protein HBH70_231920 [Parastagonospora nodorum]|nr:hypothetical protein HBH51_228210 [Parastagonospora nodorum]KAH4043179.1 hypothetical protein HBH49_237250 [Parastagonospora nodorum]KAH4056756.1 hypothetical protein HBH50_239900 [Parastagonospora nodorum]KAH4077801.1 hypothetical protein HBH48_237560 [Parastagonospora nodorum]KAH4081707.1 hypothetical protein HBH46_224400 [Parastagonospora nodorum]